MQTLNNVITSIKGFCENHGQLASFYSGEMFNFKSTEQVYPAFVLSTRPAVIQNGRVRATFQAYCCDLLENDESNVDEVHSDTLQVLQDFFAEFRDQEELYGFVIGDEEMPLEPIIARLEDDNTAGWLALFTAEYDYAPNRCDLPKKS